MFILNLINVQTIWATTTTSTEDDFYNVENNIDIDYLKITPIVKDQGENEDNFLINEDELCIDNDEGFRNQNEPFRVSNPLENITKNPIEFKFHSESELNKEIRENISENYTIIDNEEILNKENSNLQQPGHDKSNKVLLGVMACMFGGGGVVFAINANNQNKLQVTSQNPSAIKDLTTNELMIILNKIFNTQESNEIYQKIFDKTPIYFDQYTILKYDLDLINTLMEKKNSQDPYKEVYKILLICLLKQELSHEYYKGITQEQKQILIEHIINNNFIHISLQHSLTSPNPEEPIHCTIFNILSKNKTTSHSFSKEKSSSEGVASSKQSIKSSSEEIVSSKQPTEEQQPEKKEPSNLSEKPQVIESLVEKNKEEIIHQEDNKKEIIHQEDNEEEIIHQEDNKKEIIHQEDNKEEIIHQEDNKEEIIYQEDNEEEIIHQEDNKEEIIYQEDNKKEIIHQEDNKKEIIHQEDNKEEIQKKPFIVNQISKELDQTLLLQSINLQKIATKEAIEKEAIEEIIEKYLEGKQLVESKSIKSVFVLEEERKMELFSQMLYQAEIYQSKTLLDFLNSSTLQQFVNNNKYNIKLSNPFIIPFFNKTPINNINDLINALCFFCLKGCERISNNMEPILIFEFLNGLTKSSFLSADSGLGKSTIGLLKVVVALLLPIVENKSNSDLNFIEINKQIMREMDKIVLVNMNGAKFFTSIGYDNLQEFCKYVQLQHPGKKVFINIDECKLGDFDEKRDGSALKAFADYLEAHEKHLILSITTNDHNDSGKKESFNIFKTKILYVDSHQGNLSLNKTKFEFNYDKISFSTEFSSFVDQNIKKINSIEEGLTGTDSGVRRVLSIYKNGFQSLMKQQKNLNFKEQMFRVIAYNIFENKKTLNIDKMINRRVQSLTTKNDIPVNKKLSPSKTSMKFLSTKNDDRIDENLLDQNFSFSNIPSELSNNKSNSNKEYNLSNYENIKNKLFTFPEPKKISINAKKTNSNFIESQKKIFLKKGEGKNVGTIQKNIKLN